VTPFLLFSIKSELSFEIFMISRLLSSDKISNLFSKSFFESDDEHSENNSKEHRRILCLQKMY